MFKLSSSCFFAGCRLPGRQSLFQRASRTCATTTDRVKPTMKEVLAMRMKVRPMSLADYMKECVRNPELGYYATQDALGEHGDFITSPEMCSMIGELLSIWLHFEVEAFLKPEHKEVALVEFGPGSGYLLGDMLRNMSMINPDIKFDVSLVETSEKLQKVQKEFFDKLELKNCKFTWYDQFHLTPVYTHPSEKPFVIIAHEFFDSLPVHVFSKSPENEWNEVFVDYDKEKNEMKYCLNPEETPAQKLAKRFLDAADPSQDVQEVGFEGLALVQLIARLMAPKDSDKLNKGSALIIDYGHSGEEYNTLRAFKKHGQVEPLEDPGLCDITADVNFSHMQSMIDSCNAKYSEEGKKVVETFGPKPQAEFLNNLGLQFRVQALMSMIKEEKTKQGLQNVVNYLVDPLGMGGRFKFFQFSSATADRTHPPVGYLPITAPDDVNENNEPPKSSN